MKLIQRVKILPEHKCAGQKGSIELDENGEIECDSMFGFAKVTLDSGLTCHVLGDQVELLELKELSNQ